MSFIRRYRAHVGLFTTAAAMAVGLEGCVIAIEQKRHNYELLLENIKANDPTNVTAINKGAWSERGELTFNLFSEQRAFSRFYTDHYHNTSRANDAQTVQTDTVDAMLSELGVERAAFVKMDIEGAEVEAVKGMTKLLSQPGVHFAFALYHVVDGHPTRQAVDHGWRRSVSHCTTKVKSLTGGNHKTETKPEVFQGGQLKVLDIAAKLNQILPEGFLKTLAARLYCRWWNPLYRLNALIDTVETCTEPGLIKIHMTDGTVYCTPVRGRHSLMLDYGNRKNLDKLQGCSGIGSVVWSLSEQYIDDIHQRHYHLKAGDTVVDAGANIGTFTVRAAQAVGPSGRVIAIEPEPENLRILMMNVEANHLENVTIIAKGLWSEPGTMALSLAENPGEHSFLGGMTGVGTTTVETDTLDAVIAGLGIEWVDYVKMDIEGAELKAVHGMSSVLSQNVNLALECGHIVDGVRTYTTVAPFLEQSGFTITIEQDTVYAWKAK